MSSGLHFPKSEGSSSKENNKGHIQHLMTKYKVHSKNITKLSKKQAFNKHLLPLNDGLSFNGIIGLNSF
jgi:hypothetical protein